MRYNDGEKCCTAPPCCLCTVSERFMHFRRIFFKPGMIIFGRSHTPRVENGFRTIWVFIIHTFFWCLDLCCVILRPRHKPHAYALATLLAKTHVPTITKLKQFLLTLRNWRSAETKVIKKAKLKNAPIFCLMSKLLRNSTQVSGRNCRSFRGKSIEGNIKRNFSVKVCIYFYRDHLTSFVFGK
jgi:hypothetical protein